MSLYEAMTKQINKALVAVRLPFRARLTKLQTKTPVQLVQGEGLSQEQLQSVELLQQFGFTSGVPTDSQLVVLPIGGKTVHSVIIATENTAFRVQVEQGETAIYNQWGAKVVLKKDKIIEIDCEQLKISAKKSITMQTEDFSLQGKTYMLDTSNVTIKAKLQVEGNVNTSGTIQSDGDHVAAGISLSQHTHGGVESGGSITEKPS